MKMNNIKVSVLIGTYNRANLLTRCLDSIFDQTYKNLEVIVINDASTDNTIDILENYKEKYGDNFIYINNKENKGIAFNSNLAYSHSTGEYLALIGDDDYWCDKNKLEKQLKLFYNPNENVGVVGTWWIEKNKENEIKRTPEEPKNWKKRLLSGGGIICGSSALIAKKAWEKAGGFDERMPRGTDSDLFRNIIINGFEGRILKNYTTIVDVGHSINRMTPKKSSAALKRENDAIKLLLNKYSKEFKKYKRIKYKRYFTIIKNSGTIFSKRIISLWKKE